MKAAVYYRHGSPNEIRLEEIEKPSPKKDEVLVRVHAASVNALDSHLLRAIPGVAAVLNLMGSSKPKVPGRDLAGRVEAIGSAVTTFSPGDEVFGCGRGTFADYAICPERAIIKKPPKVSFESAASVGVAGLTALQGLRDSGKIQSGQKVLIEGAGGGVGTFAVQIAKSYGAEVTAVCSTRNQGVARSIGADFAIDYTKEDFVDAGKRYDLIMRANGYHKISAYKKALTPNGIVVLAGTSKPQIPQALLQGFLHGPLVSIMGKQKIRVSLAKVTTADLQFLAGLLESGKLKPTIDRQFPLAEAAEAIRYLEQWHAGGKVIVQVQKTT